MSEKRNKFVERLALAMKVHGYDRHDLSVLASVSARHIGSLARGDRKPSLSMLMRMADVLEVSVDYLLGRSEDPFLVEEQRLRADLIAVAGALRRVKENRAAFKFAAKDEK